MGSSLPQRDTGRTELWPCEERAQMVDISEAVSEEEVKALLAEADVIRTLLDGQKVLVSMLMVTFSDCT